MAGVVRIAMVAGEPSGDLLASHLAKIEGTPAPTSPAVLDADLRKRIRAFQRSQGLDADGRPGPMTFMQMERAAGVAQPSLQH